MKQLIMHLYMYKERKYQSRTTETVRTEKMQILNLLARAGYKSTFQQMTEHSEGSITYETSQNSWFPSDIITVCFPKPHCWD